MKTLIKVLLFTLIGLSAKAQLPSSTFPSRIFNGNTKAQWILLDSPVVNPILDTFHARYAGTQIVRIQGGDTAFWFYGGNRRWFRSLLDRDTLSLSNRINLKLNISDTAGKWLAQSTRLVDTMYRVNDSTIGYTIKGNAYTFQILGGSSGGGGGSGTVTSVGLSLPSAFNVTPSTITTSGTFAVTAAGTTSEYIRGNGTLATTDTTMIPNFYLKVRGLLSGTSPITFNQAAGGIGINNANTSGTKGAATFSAAFTDNGSGTIDLANLVSAGSCTGCNLNIDAKGRITGYSDGAGGATDNVNIGTGIRVLNATTQEMRTFFAGFGVSIDSVANANGITWRADTTRSSGLPTKFYIDSLVEAFDDDIIANGLNRSGDSILMGGPLTKYTHIRTINQKSNPDIAGTNAIMISNTSLDSSNAYWLVGNDPSTAYWQRPNILSSLIYRETDTLSRQYGGTYNGVMEHHFSPSYTRFKNPLTPMFIPYGGTNMTNRIFPPDTAYVWASVFGNTAGVYSGDVAIGDTNSYYLWIRSADTVYPLNAARMGIDLARTTNNHKREVRGAGIAGYTFDWRSYQAGISAGTTEWGSYTNKLYGYMYYGTIYPHTESPSKEKTLAVSTIDSSFAFYTVPINTDKNEVKNGYAFVSVGSRDWSYLKGYLKVGDSMQSAVNTQYDRLHVDGSVRIVGKNDTAQLVIILDTSQLAPIMKVQNSSLQDIFAIRKRGTRSLAIGSHAGQLSTGTENIAIGDSAMAYALSTAEFNTAIGPRALKNATTGDGNIAIGTGSLQSLTTGGNNLALGSMAVHTTGNSNSALGVGALNNSLTGSNNTAAGSFTLANHGSGNNNTAIGVQAGENNLVGTANVFIGYQAGRNETGDNKLYIANSSTATPLILGDFSAAALTVNGTLASTSLDTDNTPPATTGATKMLISDAVGKVSFTDIPSAATTVYTGDGTLLGSRTVNTAGNTLTITGANDGETSFSVVNTGTTGANAIAGSTTGTTSIGVSGTSSAYIGVYGSSTSNNGIQGESSSGTGVVGVSSSGAAFRGQINPSSNNTIAYARTVLRTSSSGAGANGIGVGDQYELETATSGTSQIAGATAFVWSDATNLTRTSRWEAYVVDNAITARKAALAGSGQWTWDGYGSNTFTGTSTSILTSTASGDIIESTPGNLLEFSASNIQFNDAYMVSIPNNQLNLKSVMKRLAYDAPDANFTTLSTRQEGLYQLGDITANRTFELFTGSSVSGYEYYVYNGNTTGNTWSFSGNPPKKSSDGSTVTTMTNGVMYHLVGTYVNSTAVWVIVNQ